MNTSPLNTSMGNNNNNNQVILTESNQGNNQATGGNNQFISAKSNNETFGVIEEQSSGYQEFIPYDEQKELARNKKAAPKKNRAMSPTNKSRGQRQSFTNGQSRQKRASFNGMHDGVSMNDESQ